MKVYGLLVMVSATLSASTTYYLLNRMRFDKRKIHHSLFDATERYSNRLRSGTSAWTPEESKIVSEHKRIWWNENGTRFFLGLALWFAFLITIIATKPLVEKPVIGILMCTWMFGGISSLVWFFNREKSKLTVKELRALIPILELTPIQRAYAESLLAMEGIGMSGSEKDDLLQRLNRLVEEEEKLLAAREEGGLQAGTRENILQDRANLIAKIEASHDELSRKSFAKGLEICERRLAAVDDLFLTDERVEAQLELIRQAMCGVRDSLHRLRLTPRASIADLNLDHLNDSVFHAHRQTEALEAAVAEVRAISG
ncbi:MAG: hypothetical protein ACAH95_11175 [Fimbriimonas sp.]